MELCVSNYATLDGLINGANGTFQDYVENNRKPLIWIYFHNPQIGINTWIKNSHIYDQFVTTNKKWTLVQQKIAKIQINSDPFHIITRIQFPIQIAITRTIHRAHGLTLDHLAFDPSGITKHGLTYTILSRVHSKKHLYLLSPLSNKNFQVDTLVQEEMHCLKTIAQYKITIVYLKSYHKEFIIIQSLNIHSLILHFQDILNYLNLLPSHIFGLNEIKIQNIQTHQEIYNII